LWVGQPPDHPPDPPPTPRTQFVFEGESWRALEEADAIDGWLDECCALEESEEEFGTGQDATTEAVAEPPAARG